tara:strand:- start:371 stop:559 length:189 start_codon:yes stop_codon:yes gene_type:complete
VLVAVYHFFLARDALKRTTEANPHYNFYMYVYVHRCDIFFRDIVISLKTSARRVTLQESNFA